MAVLSRDYYDCTVMLSYEWEESFQHRPPKGCLQVILIEEGCVVLRLNQERCFLQAGALLFLHDGIKVERLYSRGLRAKSISFCPGFVNLNLTIDNIRREDFELLRQQ